MLAIVRSPMVQKGQALLRNGDDLWLFLPKSRKVTRVGAKEQSMGGEVSNADLLRVDLALDYDQTFLAKEEVDGQMCWKLELKGRKRTLAYDRILYWISEKQELPVKREYYSLSGQLLKTATFSEVTTIGGRLVPKKTTIVNALNTDYKTVMETKEIKTDAKISDQMFTTGWLESGGSLER